MLIPATLLAFTMVAYLVGTIGAILASSGDDGELGRRLATWAVASGWLLHGAALLALARAEGRFAPVNLSEYLLLFGWAVIAAHLVVGVRGGVHATALILPPLALLAVSVGATLPSPAASETASRGGAWFVFHTAAATLGMAVLSLALAMSLLYVVLDRALKSRRRLAWLARLPPLERCDRIGYFALLFGFVLLTIGIATGVVVSQVVHERVMMSSIKQLAPILAWLVFAVVLGTRAVLGFRGRRAAYLTIAGVAIGLLAAAGMSV